MKISEHFMENFYDIKDPKGRSFSNQWTAINLEKILTWNRKSHSTPYLSEIKRGVYFCTGMTKNTMYRPTLTKLICNKYAKCGYVLDPCCGWGGRMMGTVASGANYIGFEPNTKTYNNLLKIVSFLGIEHLVQIYNDVAENIHKYDVVLKFRFDGCVLTTSGNLQFLDFDENEVIMPDRGVCVENQIIGYKTGIGHNVKIENKNYIIGDCFFYGSHSSRLLHKIYYSLENLINKNKTCLPESIVGHFLIDNGIKIKNQKIIDFIIRKKINPLEMTNELNYLIKNNVTKFCVPDPAKNVVTKKDKNVSIKSRPYVFSDALNVKRQV